MDFSRCLDMLKMGFKMTRKGWNGKGMYLYYVPAQSYPAVTDIAKKEFGDMVSYRDYMAMKTVDNYVVPWVASQTDLLAEDWEVYKVKKVEKDDWTKGADAKVDFRTFTKRR